jgi:hypothetical protein
MEGPKVTPRLVSFLDGRIDSGWLSVSHLRCLPSLDMPVHTLFQGELVVLFHALAKESPAKLRRRSAWWNPLGFGKVAGLQEIGVHPVELLGHSRVPRLHLLLHLPVPFPSDRLVFAQALDQN